MTSLQLPIYSSKEEAYASLDQVVSYIPYSDVYLSHFKTPEFKKIEAEAKTASETSIRNTDKYLDDYSIPIVPGLNYKIATCIFSENSKTLGLRKHIHLPKTNLPTVTIAKKIYNGNDDVSFVFHRKNSPPNIQMTRDFVLRFNSCTMPHSVEVKDNTQSIWLFIVLEHCSDIDLEQVREFYNCEQIYDYYEKV